MLLPNQSVQMAERNVGTPPRKKQKSMQRYRKEYSKEFPVFTTSSKDDTFAFCTVCCVHLSVAHGGRDDLKKTHKKRQAFGFNQATR